VLNGIAVGPVFSMFVSVLDKVLCCLRTFLRCTLMLSLNPRLNVFVIFYADYILLISPPVTSLLCYYGIVGKTLMIWTWSLLLNNVAVCVLFLDVISIVKNNHNRMVVSHTGLM